MFKRKSHEHEDEQKTPPTTAEAPAPVDKFRAEAEEHAARVERARIEHIAAERGVTVAELLASAPTPVEENFKDAHVRESLRESEKAAHKRAH